MIAIVSVDLNWGIGYKGSLLQRIPEDTKFFRETTLNKVVVMGRDTLESLPGGNPLKNRVNIVMTRNPFYKKENAVVCNSLSELAADLSAALSAELDKQVSDDVFVIGGESVYKQLLPYCSKAYVTKFYHEYQADRYFPNLDEEEGWRLESAGELKSYGNIEYSFTTYVNDNVKSILITN